MGGIELLLQGLEEKKFLLDLVLLLGAASIGGWLSGLIKMPKVLGQIVIGIILGPTVLGWLNGQNEMIHTMSEIGVIFLMFLAGLETDINELKSSGKGASIIAMGGVIFPIFFGTIIPYFFFKQYLPTGSGHQQFLFALYIGTILTATSVSISVSVLRDMNKLGSKEGISILGAAIIDDVLGIILLAVITGMVNPSGNSSIIGLVIRIVSFFILSFIVGVIISKLITNFAMGSAWSEKVIIFAIILCFLFAFMAEVFKIAAITGAYVVGVIFSTTPYQRKITNRIQVLAYSLFTPIFFVSIGLKVAITAEILKYWKYAIVIVLIAIFGKIIGCGLGALLSKFKLNQAIQVGIGMIARAEVALIIASQGMASKIISDATFTSIVLLVVISTLVTPPLLKYSFSNEKAQNPI
jgi:Kef-type K+ transport system membrane component KefB